MVDAGADVVEFGKRFCTQNFGNLFGAMLDPVAKTDSVDLAIFDGAHVFIAIGLA